MKEDTRRWEGSEKAEMTNGKDVKGEWNGKRKVIEKRVRRK